MTEHMLELDLDDVTDKAALMDRCVRHLELPDRFGRTWDALAEGLAALPDGPESGPVLVVVRNWRQYARSRPEEWEIAQEVFSSAADRAPALSVVLALGGSS
ncbi:barstar family protein [Streptomyces sp. NPDC058291]|jgi:hypothetical protein|uniref:barstar family protein n=1 Tax=Streptomyces sp. NPDC058291 TaxID=3346427 RepID=UPI0036E02122